MSQRSGLRETIVGMSRLLRQIKRIGDVGVNKEVVEDAMEKALTPFVARAKQLAPRGKGQRHRLAESIGIRKTGEGRTQAVSVYVGGDGNGRVGAAFYWLFLEFGTSKMDKQPFLRPAWDQTKNVVKRIFVQEIKKAIEAAAHRAGAE